MAERTLKARNHRGKYAIDYHEWNHMLEDDSDDLFDDLCEQQSSYVSSIQKMQAKLAEYGDQIVYLSKNTSEDKADTTKIAELEAKLLAQSERESKHKSQIEGLKRKLVIEGKQQEKLNDEIANLRRQMSTQGDGQKMQIELLNDKISDQTLKIETYQGQVASLEAKQRIKEKLHNLSVADLNTELATLQEQEKQYKDRIAVLEDERGAQYIDRDRHTPRVESVNETTFVFSKNNASPTKPLPDPPKFHDGVNPKFVNWKYLMEMKFRENSDHFDTPTSRLAYLISCMSDEAQDQLLTRLRSKILAPLADVKEALEYLTMLYHDPELRATDVHDFRSPRSATSTFWVFYRDFVWNAVKHELPEVVWNLKLHEYLHWKLGKNIGDFSSYAEGPSKELAKQVLLRLLRQEWDDSDGFDKI